MNLSAVGAAAAVAEYTAAPASAAADDNCYCQLEERTQSSAAAKFVDAVFAVVAEAVDGATDSAVVELAAAVGRAAVLNEDL